MAITVIPPSALIDAEKIDINVLTGLLAVLSGILDREAAIVEADRTMSTDSIDSLNNTLIDASDRIDAIINPPALA